MSNANSNSGSNDRPKTPDYAEMAARLREVGRDLLRQGRSQHAKDLIEKAHRILSLADQICPENGG